MIADGRSRTQVSAFGQSEKAFQYFILCRRNRPSSLLPVQSTDGWSCLSLLACAGAHRALILGRDLDAEPPAAVLSAGAFLTPRRMRDSALLA